MRAVVVRQYGDDPFELVDVDRPVAGPGEVRIRIHAAPVTFGDALTTVGRYQVKPKLPFVPGNEGAGVIDQVGPGVTAHRIGDRVAATGFIGDTRGDDARVIGSFGEYAVVPIENVTPIPDGVTLAQAALFRSAFETSYYALQRGRLAAGEQLVVLGASGGLGDAAVQIGRQMGAYVIASTRGPEKRAAALASGAHIAIDHDAPDWRDQIAEATGGRGIDVVFDPIGGPALERAFRSLAYGGRHVVVGFASGNIAALPTNLPLVKAASLIGANASHLQERDRSTALANARTLFGWLAEGKLRLAEAGRVYDLAEAGQATLDVLDGRIAGRALVRMSDDREERA